MNERKWIYIYNCFNLFNSFFIKSNKNYLVDFLLIIIIYNKTKKNKNKMINLILYSFSCFILYTTK